MLQEKLPWVTEVKGHLEKLYLELDEINAQEKIKIEELAKMRALHTAKLEEARVLSARLHQLREQQIARLHSEIHAIRSTPGYARNDTAVGNEQPIERIIEEDRGGAVAVCGADDGNGDEEMEDQNQEGNADGEDEDDEDDADEDDEDDEDAEDEDEDEDDEHGDEDGGEAAEDDEEDDSETGHGGRWSSGSNDGGGEYPAYDDDSGSADSDAYRRPSSTSYYDPWD